MPDIEKFFDDALSKDVITEEARQIKAYIEETWPKFKVELERPLKDLFPKPTNVGLNHIWKYGSADVVVRKNDKVICIIEPGGSHHFQDEKQMKNDKRKWKLCDTNGVRCLRIANNVLFVLSNRQRRNLLGKFIFGMPKAV